MIALAVLLAGPLHGVDSRLANRPRQQCAMALPDPTGPFAVGTIVEKVVDSSRRGGEFPGGRPIILQAWYPANRNTAQGIRAPYLIEAALAAALADQQYYEVERDRLAAWTCLRSTAVLDAPPTAGTHPLLTFSVGLGVIRANYTSLATELASHGYIVLMVESPLAGMMVVGAGALVQDTSTTDISAALHAQRVSEWAGDVSFALDHLHKARGVLRPLRTSVDWTEIGAVGHSSGGLVALEVCQRDVRVRACADLDGGLVTPENEPLAPFVATGLDRPTLVLRSRPLYSDADLARRGLTREQWLNRAGAGANEFEVLATHSRGRIDEVFIAGTGHMSFTDAPFVMPTTITRFGGQIIDANRGWLVITTLLRAYFAQQFGINDGKGLAASAEQFPEVEVHVLRD